MNSSKGKLGTTVKVKRENVEVFFRLIKNQFEHGGEKYAGDDNREFTDLICDAFPGDSGVDWVLGTMMKYLGRFKHFRREKDLLKVATYCYIIWLKFGFHIEDDHDEDIFATETEKKLMDRIDKQEEYCENQLCVANDKGICIDDPMVRRCEEQLPLKELVEKMETGAPVKLPVKTPLDNLDDIYSEKEAARVTERKVPRRIPDKFPNNENILYNGPVKCAELCESAKESGCDTQCEEEDGFNVESTEN